jgi:inorganic pyrophosphatase
VRWLIRAPSGQEATVDDALIDVLVESPKGSRIKYEWDDDRQAIRFDRHLYSATVFPADYGYIADTIGADGETP